jgi:[ribosomal protein S5]-alanine N-acetyltransferase
MVNTSVFDAFPILKTNRLTLRDIRISDADEIYKMRASGRVNQFIPRPEMQTQEDAIALIEKIQLAFKNKQAIGFAGILRNSNTIIGTCGFNSIEIQNMRAELGGEMAVEYWGKNIALEAVESIIAFGFNTLLLHSIEAKVSPDNRGAVFVLEQLGFKKEAHFKDRIFYKNKFSDMAVYTKFRN